MSTIYLISGEYETESDGDPETVTVPADVMLSQFAINLRCSSRWLTGLFA